MYYITITAASPEIQAIKKALKADKMDSLSDMARYIYLSLINGHALVGSKKDFSAEQAAMLKNQKLRIRNKKAKNYDVKGDKNFYPCLGACLFSEKAKSALKWLAEKNIHGDSYTEIYNQYLSDDAKVILPHPAMILSHDFDRFRTDEQNAIAWKFYENKNEQLSTLWASINQESSSLVEEIQALIEKASGDVKTHLEAALKAAKG